ncbi:MULTISPECIES: hypothetical protein [unclassified Bartonella]|uniref:hypothetical protein n=1 Tax=unclassified Bartonella TaxID=2645622 RepID=UPI0035D054D1
MAIAEIKHCSASQILRDLIRVYVENNKIPNKETLETFHKNDSNEDVFYAENIADLIKQLDI